MEHTKFLSDLEQKILCDSGDELLTTFSCFSQFLVVDIKTATTFLPVIGAQQIHDDDE